MGNNKTKKNNSKPVIKEMTLPERKTISPYYIYGIIVLFCFVLYGNTIRNDYALDDVLVITENKYVQDGVGGIKNIFLYDSFKGYDERYLNSVAGGRYRPLSIATFAIENQLFGVNPHISHFINICFYALSCVLVFIVLSKVLKQFPVNDWFQSMAFIATLLFAAHPIHTEVVGNIKGRDEILSFLFASLALWFLLKHADHNKMKYMVFASVSYFLSLLSKEIAVVFGFLIPLTFYFFTDISLKKILRSAIPLIVITVLFIVLRQTLIGKTTEVSVPEGLMNDSFSEMNTSQRYATIVYTLGYYLKLIFVPHPLTWDYYPYHIPIMEWGNGLVLISLVLYLFLAYVALKGLKNKSFFSYCIFLYFVPLLLTSNILFSIGAFMSERFIYISSLGFALLIAYLAVVKPAPLFRTIFSKPLLLIVPVLLLFSFKVIDRNKDWKDSVTLIAADVNTSVNSAKGNSEHGKHLYEKAEKLTDAEARGRIYEKALMHLEKAFKVDPNQCLTNFYMGTIYGRQRGDLDKAIYYLNNAMHLDPKHIESYNNLGTAYGIKQQYDKALEVFESALKVAPDNQEVLSNLSITYQRLGNQEKAAAFAKRAQEVKETQKKK